MGIGVKLGTSFLVLYLIGFVSDKGYRKKPSNPMILVSGLVITALAFALLSGFFLIFTHLFPFSQNFPRSIISALHLLELLPDALIPASWPTFSRFQTHHYLALTYLFLLSIMLSMTRCYAGKYARRREANREYIGRIYIFRHDSSEYAGRLIEIQPDKEAYHLETLYRKAGSNWEEIGSPGKTVILSSLSEIMFESEETFIEENRANIIRSRENKIKEVFVEINSVKDGLKTIFSTKKMRRHSSSPGAYIGSVEVSHITPGNRLSVMARVESKEDRFNATVPLVKDWRIPDDLPEGTVTRAYRGGVEESIKIEHPSDIDRLLEMEKDLKKRVREKKALHVESEEGLSVFLCPTKAKRAQIYIGWWPEHLREKIEEILEAL